MIVNKEVLRNKFLEEKYNEKNYLQLLREIFATDLGHSYEYDEYPNFKILGSVNLDDREIALLSVKVDNEKQLENVRKYHHQTVMKFLKEKEIDSAIVSFYCENCNNWRISTPTKQIWELIEKRNKEGYITFEDIKETFSVEKLTDEFFKKYRNLYIKLKEHVEKEPANKPLIENLKNNGYSVDDFAKKLLGQLVFLYFLQKKGWLGVPEDKPYGEGDKKFLRNLFEKARKENKNYYLDYLIPLFYETLNNPRENQMIPDWSEIFKCIYKHFDKHR